MATPTITQLDEKQISMTTEQESTEQESGYSDIYRVLTSKHFLRFFR